MLPITRIAVIGGGAAGFFAAITSAEALGGAGEVTLYEATPHLLAKVRVSGGGRCNVTHACFEPAELIKKYPRGGRELLGAFHRFQPRDTVAWFAARDVATKTEEDGRMFPVTDDSQTIIECLMAAARKADVKIIPSMGVRKAEWVEEKFLLTFTNGSAARYDRLIIATGGNKSSGGLAMAESFGHTIIPPVPSLFTFHIQDTRLHDLSGVSVENVVLTAPGTKLRTDGPLLVTHWGVSGPAVLKLSAWGAREFAGQNYSFPININWVPPRTRDTLLKELAQVREQNARKQVATFSPVPMPQRLWERFVIAAGIPATTPWAHVSNPSLQALATQLTASEFKVDGKSMFKDEFVTCGGVKLSEVDFKTMESRQRPGLYFAGEVLDVDGVTGGFNFQNAWTTGYLAGSAAAQPRA
ncbi:MAG: NAD(P)/FAD-dependent oxidoreductase [Opitutales bacterium]|nr:MAG: NAD(P)/FAD-dependent oxidoreductase [Opitutales bacterium]